MISLKQEAFLRLRLILIAFATSVGVTSVILLGVDDCALSLLLLTCVSYDFLLSGIKIDFLRNKLIYKLFTYSSLIL